MKRMLINATQQEELRIALVDGQRLYDLNIETLNSKQKKSNIYKGKITKIEPSLEASFIDYGAEKQGFLPFKEISKEYFLLNKNKNQNSINVKDLIFEGQEIIVQINKEERNNKGASLTTFISLAGSYLILMPNNPNSGGISRKIAGENRNILKSMFSLLNIPKGMSVIIRTAGLGKTINLLKWDLNLKLEYWKVIKQVYKSNSAPFLIHSDSNIIIRAFRDCLNSDIHEIIIDNPKILKEAKEYINLLGRSDFINKIKFYNNNVPIFTFYQIESQIESAFKRKLKLPSGGSIIIDNTEALTAIDINSSKSTKGLDIEETAFNTNIEAVNEIALQLRLRDLGGLIVIDFIDMALFKNKRIVEKCLKEATKQDRARIQLSKISHFGLLELSRQRLNPSLCELNYYICPRCKGTGNIRDNKSLALSILRLIEIESIKKNTFAIQVRVPVKIASYLLNIKRNIINNIEFKKNINVIIIPDVSINSPNYYMIRIRCGEEISNLNYLFNKSKIDNNNLNLYHNLIKYNLSKNNKKFSVNFFNRIFNKIKFFLKNLIFFTKDTNIKNKNILLEKEYLKNNLNIKYTKYKNFFIKKNIKK